MSYFNTVFFEGYWNIGVAEDDITRLAEGKKSPIKWFPGAISEQFLADPFAVRDPKDRSVLHIFCEIFSFKNNKGRIGHLTYNIESKEFSGIETVLEEDYHLSYPFIIESGRDIFMVPESSANSEVAIYKALDFPAKWEKVKVIIDNYPGVDNTIINFDNTWWLFSTDMEKGEHSYLNIFYSDKLLGNWIAHPENPVKTGRQTHRSAGTPFLYDGDLVRPSMNCSNKYGENIILNKISTLTKETFKEEVIGEIYPQANSLFKDKTHTLSKVDHFTLVDGCNEVFVCTNPHIFIYKVKTLFGKIKNRLQ